MPGIRFAVPDNDCENHIHFYMVTHLIEVTEDSEFCFRCQLPKVASCSMCKRCVDCSSSRLCQGPRHTYMFEKRLDRLVNRALITTSVRAAIDILCVCKARPDLAYYKNHQGKSVISVCMLFHLDNTLRFIQGEEMSTTCFDLDMKYLLAQKNIILQ